MRKHYKESVCKIQKSKRCAHTFASVFPERLVSHFDVGVKRRVFSNLLSKKEKPHKKSVTKSNKYGSFDVGFIHWLSLIHS